MGKVAISISLTPESPEVDLEELEKKVKNELDIEDTKEEPIGFGLKKLKIMVLRPDTEGQGTDDLEKKLSDIEGIKSVEVENVTLI